MGGKDGEEDENSRDVNCDSTNDSRIREIEIERYRDEPHN